MVRRAKPSFFERFTGSDIDPVSDCAVTETYLYVNELGKRRRIALATLRKHFDTDYDEEVFVFGRCTHFRLFTYRKRCAVCEHLVSLLA